VERALPCERPSGRQIAEIRQQLKTKNDESRFGLTRAPFLERHVRRSVTKVIACRRAARNGLTNRVGVVLLEELPKTLAEPALTSRPA
jgi:hypothetical protein